MTHIDYRRKMYRKAKNRPDPINPNNTKVFAKISIPLPLYERWTRPESSEVDKTVFEVPHQKRSRIPSAKNSSECFFRSEKYRAHQNLVRTSVTAFWHKKIESCRWRLRSRLRANKYNSQSGLKSKPAKYSSFCRERKEYWRRNKGSRLM